MNNKTIIQLIKKDLEELRILVDDIENSENTEQQLIEITQAKVQTMLKEFMLLKGTEQQPLSTTFEQTQTVTDFVSAETTANELVAEEEIQLENIVEDAPEVFEVPENAPEIFEETNIDRSEEQTISEDTVEEEQLIAEVFENETIEDEASEKVEDIVEVEPIAEPFDIVVEEIIEMPEPIIIEEPIVIEEPIKETEPVFVEEPKLEEIGSVDSHTVNLLSAENIENTDKKVFGEQFSKEPSLNDRLGSMKNNETKIKGLPITNLKSAIGINDRFLFTRELFGNINSKFEATIEAIDQAKDIMEAIEYLEQNFKWQKNATSLKFLELVKRRFDK